MGRIALSHSFLQMKKDVKGVSAAAPRPKQRSYTGVPATSAAVKKSTAVPTNSTPKNNNAASRPKPSPISVALPSSVTQKKTEPAASVKRSEDSTQETAAKTVVYIPPKPLSTELKKQILVVKGVPVGVSAEQVAAKLASFGKLGDARVSVKPGASTQVVFVDIEISEQGVHRCQSILGRTKWSGSQISIQVAKHEYYLKRIERERLEAADLHRRVTRLERKRKRAALRGLCGPAALSDDKARKAPGWGVGRYNRPVAIVRIARPDNSIVKIAPENTHETLLRLGIHLTEDTPSSELTWSLGGDAYDPAMLFSDSDSDAEQDSFQQKRSNGPPKALQATKSHKSAGVAIRSGSDASKSHSGSSGARNQSSASGSASRPSAASSNGGANGSDSEEDDKDEEAQSEAASDFDSESDDGEDSIGNDDDDADHDDVAALDDDADETLKGSMDVDEQDADDDRFKLTAQFNEEDDALPKPAPKPAAPAKRSFQVSSSILDIVKPAVKSTFSFFAQPEEETPTPVAQEKDEEAVPVVERAPIVGSTAVRPKLFFSPEYLRAQIAFVSRVVCRCLMSCSKRSDVAARRDRATSEMSFDFSGGPEPFMRTQPKSVLVDGWKAARPELIANAKKKMKQAQRSKRSKTEKQDDS
jgi:hypothetical protein